MQPAINTVSCSHNEIANGNECHMVASLLAGWRGYPVRRRRRRDYAIATGRPVRIHANTTY